MTVTRAAVRSALAGCLLLMVAACGSADDSPENGLVITALSPVPVDDMPVDDVPADGCSVDEIAAVENRLPAAIRCDGEWAYVDFGGVGDAQALLHRVDGVWEVFTAFPSRLCVDDAAARGVPQSELSSFAPCGAPPSSAVPESDDLGLTVPRTRPQCDGMGIVVLHSATDPSSYGPEVSAALDANPGAHYLRTDDSCSSLRQRSTEGNLIYAVYVEGGRTRSDLCAAVSRAGGDAYGKWLDSVSDPTQIVSC